MELAGIPLSEDGWTLSHAKLEDGRRLVLSYADDDGAGTVRVILMPRDAVERKLGRLEHCAVYYEGELTERSFEHRARAADLVAHVSHRAEELLGESGLGFPAGLAALDPPPSRVVLDADGARALLPELYESGDVFDTYATDDGQGVCLELGSVEPRAVLELSPLNTRACLGTSRQVSVVRRDLAPCGDDPRVDALCSVALVALQLRDVEGLEVVSGSAPAPTGDPPLGAPTGSLAGAAAPAFRSEGALLAPGFAAFERYFGDAPRFVALSDGDEGYAVEFPAPDRAPADATFFFAPPPCFRRRRVLSTLLRELGFRVHDDGRLRTVPTPATHVARAPRHQGFVPRLMPMDSLLVEPGKWLELYLEGVLPINVGTADLYRRSQPLLTLRTPHRLWCEHFFALAHDASVHLLATHRVPKARIAELGARVGAAHRRCEDAGRPDAREPLVRFYEQDLVSACQEIWERVATPERFGDAFDEKAPRRDLDQRLSRRLAESESLLSRAPRLAPQLSEGLDLGAAAVRDALRGAERWAKRLLR